MINLTIAIPTIEGRENKFNYIHNKIKTQIEKEGLIKEVQIISLKDNKEISIGSKRDKLIRMAEGKFMVMIDDDDDVDDQYVTLINTMIHCDDTIDCIGYYEEIRGLGNFKRSCISNMWEKWTDNDEVYNGMTFKYCRTPFFKNPILTEYCKKIGCKDIRYGEDQDFSIRLKESGLIKNEFLYERFMYFYKYQEEPFNEKYGIK